MSWSGVVLDSLKSPASSPDWAGREPGVEVTQVPGVAEGTQPGRAPPSSTSSGDAIFPASFFFFNIYLFI